MNPKDSYNPPHVLKNLMAFHELQKICYKMVTLSFCQLHRMAALLLAIFIVAHVSTIALSLQTHFYNQLCPRAEHIVKNVMARHVQQDPSVPAGLLRLHFHDCFIRGCDASVLIDSTDYNVAEKEAPPNLTLRGFDVIDDIKAELEKECPGKVSCADILAMATRDGVLLSGGPAYVLPTGRRDGTVSRMADVHIPSPSFSVPAALAAFSSINLDLVDLTTLLGAHSVGFSHCGFFIDRLYNYLGTGQPDPQLDTTFLNTLRQKCPPEVVTIANISKDPTVFVNQMTSTPFALDNSFYQTVLDGKAVLQLDQELAFTDVTNNLATQFLANPDFFKEQFSKSMIKLGSVGVLTGQDGEIRVNCRSVNGNTPGT